MKTLKKFALALLVITSLSCKAQIVGLDAGYDVPDGTYYKDLNNELDRFEGTWVYTNGDISLTIILEKDEYQPVLDNFRDYLRGEYKYAVSGQEVVNTLPNLSNNSVQKNIGGSYIHKKTDYPACNNCGENERRIDMYFNDPERSYLQDGIVIRYLEGENNPEKIEVIIYQDEGGIIPDVNSPVKPRVPYGTYVMEKQ